MRYNYFRCKMKKSSIKKIKNKKILIATIALIVLLGACISVVSHQDKNNDGNAVLSEVPRRIEEIIQIQVRLWEYRVPAGVQLHSAVVL